MRVYVVVEEQDELSSGVAGVFASEAGAVDYVISERFRGNSYYADRADEFLYAEALRFVELHEVVPDTKGE